MRGLTDILESFKEYEGPASEKEYVKAVIIAFEFISSEIESGGADRVLVNNICSFNVDSKKLMRVLYKHLKNQNNKAAEIGLEKLKNNDPEVFGGFLSRIERKKTRTGKLIRRAREVYEEERRNGKFRR